MTGLLLFPLGNYCTVLWLYPNTTCTLVPPPLISTFPSPLERQQIQQLSQERPAACNKNGGNGSIVSHLHTPFQLWHLVLGSIMVLTYWQCIYPRSLYGPSDHNSRVPHNTPAKCREPFYTCGAGGQRVTRYLSLAALSMAMPNRLWSLHLILKCT